LAKNSNPLAVLIAQSFFANTALKQCAHCFYEVGYCTKIDSSLNYTFYKFIAVAGTEHQRIVAGLSNHDVLYDVFAGVGPFAVPAAKKGCSVVANDLNPESYRWLQYNVKLNKVKGEIQLYNLDGREFIRSVVKKDLLDRWRASADDDDVTNKSNIHMVMNLPAIAIEFLDAFRGLILEDDLVTDGLKRDALTLPIIHCYCFSKSADVVEDARRRTEESLGVALSSASGCTVRIVRNVAPNKEMLCVTFTLPLSLLISSKDCDGDIDQSGTHSFHSDLF